MPAGYSKRSLVEKLGIKANSNIRILHAPPGYDATLGALPPGIMTKAEPPADFIQGFYLESKVLEREFPGLKQGLKTDGTLWISWPKKAAKVETDLSENIVRNVGLENGLVDIKVCAVDEVWSGLKFVYRLTDRKQS
jgi:hypothetical protein